MLGAQKKAGAVAPANHRFQAWETLYSVLEETPLEYPASLAGHPGSCYQDFLLNSG